MFVVQSAKGFILQTWVKIPKKRGGSSILTTQRVSKGAAEKMKLTTTGRPSFITKRINEKVAMESEIDSIMKHVKGRPLLGPSASDQIMLQDAGGMTNQQIHKFNQILIKITEFSVHSHKALSWH